MLLTYSLLIDSLLQNPIISMILECVYVCVCVCVHGEPEREGRAE